MKVFDPASRSRRAAATWVAYDVAVVAVTAIVYGLLAPLFGRNEGGLGWLLRRLRAAQDLPSPTGPRIWIHSVSAGEAKVAGLVRAQLLALDATVSVVLSASTRTGFARSLRTAADGAFVMPLDTLGLQRRTVRALKPDLAVLTETDFWPAHFAALMQDDVPVVALNAVISPRSVRRHTRWPRVAQATIRQARRVYVQDETEQAHFRRLGVPTDRIEVCGNLKLATAGALRRDTPAGGPPTVTFGNIHAAELPRLAPAITRLQAKRPDLRIILVPRYPGPVSTLLARGMFGRALAVVDDAEALRAPGERLVLFNAMGSLSDIYAVSNVGVVCGTFSSVGGHDLAEPMHHGAIGIYGPHVERQMALHSSLQRAGLSVQVSHARELPDRIATLLDDAAGSVAALARFDALVRHESERLKAICRDLLALAAARRDGPRAAPVRADDTTAAEAE